MECLFSFARLLQAIHTSCSMLSLLTFWVYHPLPSKRSGDADTHAHSQNPPSLWSTPTSRSMTGASLCSESTIGDDILVFTLRGNEHAMCIKVKLPSRGDRLYKWCNYYVAAHELEGTLCQMSRSQTIHIHGLEHVRAWRKDLRDAVKLMASTIFYIFHS